MANADKWHITLEHRMFPTPEAGPNLNIMKSSVAELLSNKVESLLAKCNDSLRLDDL